MWWCDLTVAYLGLVYEFQWNLTHAGWIKVNVKDDRAIHWAWYTARAYADLCHQCFRHWWFLLNSLIGYSAARSKRQYRSPTPNTTRNSPGNEIANVNYDDIVHELQNTIDWCINSATDPRGYVLERRFTKFSKITQCHGHYAVSSRSLKSVTERVRESLFSKYAKQNIILN